MNHQTGKRRPTAIFTAVLMSVLAVFAGFAGAREQQMLVRISEIEIFPQYFQEYQRILIEEAEASVRLDPGVLSIFPLVQEDNPTQVRILEIYASHDAYQSHINSPHFQKYKTSTLEMVKSLRLVDMSVMDIETMPLVFRKMTAPPSPAVVAPAHPQ